MNNIVVYLKKELFTLYYKLEYYNAASNVDYIFNNSTDVIKLLKTLSKVLKER